MGKEGDKPPRARRRCSGCPLTWLVSVPVGEGDGQPVVPDVLHPAVFVAVGAQADPPHVGLPREHHGEMRLLVAAADQVMENRLSLVSLPG